jgi:putative ABC transport system ATP-binding protein
MTPPVVELEDISRVYGEGDARVRALDHVNLTVQAGEFVALMGPSGSGKSTALHLMGCLDQPTAGSLRFLGRPVERLDADQRALLRRHWIGFIFQSFHLLPRTTALENVALPLMYRGVPAGQRAALALAALREVGLETHAAHHPNQLSGGQQQRVAIARAIVNRPALLLADEPTGNLDTARSHEIMKLIEGLRRERGITVVMVTHEEDMARYATRIVRFRDGRVERDEAAA